MKKETASFLDWKLDSFKKNCAVTLRRYGAKITEAMNFIKNIDAYPFDEDTGVKKRLKSHNGREVIVTLVDFTWAVIGWTRNEKEKKGVLWYTTNEKDDMVELQGVLEKQSLIRHPSKVLGFVGSIVDAQTGEKIYENNCYMTFPLYQYGKSFGKKRAVEIAEYEIDKYTENKKEIISSVEEFEFIVKKCVPEWIKRGENVIEKGKYSEWEDVVAKRAVDAYGAEGIELAVEALERYGQSDSIAKTKRFIGSNIETMEPARNMALELFSKFRDRERDEKGE